MDKLLESIFDKISSYNIFNNLFPGCLCCYFMEKFTRFTLCTDKFWMDIFVMYFIGMIISRIGSLIVEKIMRKIKIGKEKKFLEFAPYNEYLEASKNDDDIKIFNETNNTYRSIIALLIVVLNVYIFDQFFYDMIYKNAWGKHIIIIVALLVVIILFAFSYRKQTEYIRRRVKHNIEKNINKK